jgi:hypothetical protein
MSSRLPIGVGTIYNFDIRGAAGVLLVVYASEIRVALYIKGADPVFSISNPI